jgi:hypothetical protein
MRASFIASVLSRIPNSFQDVLCIRKLASRYAFTIAGYQVRDRVYPIRIEMLFIRDHRIIIIIIIIMFRQRAHTVQVSGSPSAVRHSDTTASARSTSERDAKRDASTPLDDVASASSR